MRMDLERYRRLHLSYDELCVAAAFLELPCIYGVSDRWMKQGKNSLYSKVVQITNGLERRGLILTELGGTVRMSKKLHKLVTCMGQAERMGRIGFSCEGGDRHIYLYQKGQTLAFLEGDGRGGCYIGSLKSVHQLETALQGIPELTAQREQSVGDLFSVDTEEWLGGLLFERRGVFYEPIFDLGWKETGTQGQKPDDLAACWKSLCRCLEGTEA